MYGAGKAVTGAMTGGGALAYTGAPVFGMVVLGLALVSAGLLFLRTSRVRGRHHGRHARA